MNENYWLVGEGDAHDDLEHGAKDMNQPMEDVMNNSLGKQYLRVPLMHIANIHLFTQIC